MYRLFKRVSSPIYENYVSNYSPSCFSQSPETLNHLQNTNLDEIQEFSDPPTVMRCSKSGKGNKNIVKTIHVNLVLKINPIKLQEHFCTLQKKKKCSPVSFCVYYRQFGAYVTPMAICHAANSKSVHKSVLCDLCVIKIVKNN